MIESNIIEWLDFGDSAQNLDVYLKKKFIPFFNFFRILLKNKSIPTIIYILLIIVSFIQICTISLINVSSEKEFLLDILNYLKNITLLYEIITSSMSYRHTFLVIFLVIIINIILIFIVFLSNTRIKVIYLALAINILNIIIYYYLIGPAINIFLTGTWCEGGTHKYLKMPCYKTTLHLSLTIVSLITLLLALLICFIYSIYSNEIDSLLINKNNNNMTRIDCNYELYFLISKMCIFIFGFFFYIMDYEEEEKFIIKILYEAYIFIICLIMSFYVYKNVYFYNNDINFINHFGWFFSTWFTLCILLKSALNLSGISNFITIGWIIITYLLNKENSITENIIITDSNIFEFNDIKSIEMYKNVLLNNLSKRNNSKIKILLFGINKKFEEFINNNPEINYQYQKYINDKKLIKKFNKEDSLPILTIIYILYSYYSEKLTNKNELILHMCYYLINKLNNHTYAMLLCSKLKSESHKNLFYKYLLSEDIKDYLIFKLNKNSNKESIKHVQISRVILYYLYIDLFKIKIYDGLTNQIDYFDLLKNNTATNKTTENFLKCGESIFKTREEIKSIWDKIIELNPFSDESHRDYMLYLDTIVQDDFLAREESKKYMILKSNKFKEKTNIYHRMFINIASSVLLVDGYLSNGKILYASQNFSFLFIYSNKELLSLTIDDLLPNCIQSFHKELINDAIKYSNIKYIFKEPKDALLKNKNNGLSSIKLFIKPVPNLSYGLIYYNYLEKVYEQAYLLILDKDLKINGFSDISQEGSSFTMNNKGYNLNPIIIGYHIGLIIPDILLLLEYKNDEFNIIKKDYLLKGYLYPIEKEKDKIKDIKYKIDIILEKIKNNKIDINEYQGDIEDDPQNIINEFNDLITELTIQKIKPFSIFYKIQLNSFIDGKYKYYRIYINRDIISENEVNSVNEVNYVIENLKDKNKNRKSIFKVGVESKKKIKINVEEKNIKQVDKNNNSLENSNLSRHSKNENEIINKENIDNENKDKTNKNIEDKNKVKQNGLIYFNKFETYNSRESISLRGCEKIKNFVINKKETFPLKIMKSLCYIFSIINIILMVLYLLQQINSFSRLSKFLKNHLFINKVKVYTASLYCICVNIRWLSHSLYRNSKPHINEEWSTFYENLLEENIQRIEDLRDYIPELEKYYDEILNKNNAISIYVYKAEKPIASNFTLDNILDKIINNGIKLMDQFNLFMSSDCQDIPKELGLKELNLYNLIEVTYYLYQQDLEIYKNENDEKNKAREAKFFFPYSLLFASLILICILFVYISYTISLHNIEIEFLSKLINFNSVDFDNYIKKLDEIKKRLRNESNDEEGKEDDMDFNEIDSKKKEDEYPDGHYNIFEEKQSNEIAEKRRNRKKMKNKQSKIQQQRRKKLNFMISFFRKKNIFFLIQVIFILVLLITYYIIFTIISSRKESNLISFDNINDSLNCVYSNSLEIFISLIRQLDSYEKNLINCSTLGNFKKMEINSISNISIPKFGNLIMQIIGNSELDKKTINKFSSLYSDNACKELMEYSNEINNCEIFWSGVLSKGIEQAITQMGVIIGTVLDELQSINSEHNSRTLIDLMGNSAFIEYVQFNEYYLFKAYNKTIIIFEEFRNEKLKYIQALITKILYIYIIISLILFALLVILVYKFNFLFSSFLNFIGILPLKFLSDDQQFYNEIIKFADKYF